MATFYNQATLTYNGMSTTSNITAGEIVSVLAVSKTAVVPSYAEDSRVTYVVSIVNSGTAPFTGLTVTDDLGTYSYNQLSLTPLTYVTGSIRYYVNGVLQEAPAIVTEKPLTIPGVQVPAGGNAMLIYETVTNEFAPPTADSTVVNTATVTGNGITETLAAMATIDVSEAPLLSITKSLNPISVPENGQITYTFVIQNSGNTAVTAGDTVSLTDTFNPKLNILSVSLDGTPLALGTGYTYDAASGLFTVPAGQITVPAATFAQDATTGAWSLTPGSTTLVVTGTL